MIRSWRVHSRIFDLAMGFLVYNHGQRLYSSGWILLFERDLCSYHLRAQGASPSQRDWQEKHLFSLGRQERIFGKPYVRRFDKAVATFRYSSDRPSIRPLSGVQLWATVLVHRISSNTLDGALWTFGWDRGSSLHRAWCVRRKVATLYRTRR